MPVIYDFLHKFYKKFSKPHPIGGLIKKGLIVGKDFNMLGGVIIDPDHCWHITIGDDVTLAPRVHILAHDASTKNYLNYTKIGKVKIGNRVFIGASSTILPGVTIGDNVIIGAGSVVTRDIPSGVVASGNPCKEMCRIDEFLARKKKEMETYPCFGEEYTSERNVTNEMKTEMNDKMKNRFGYII